MFIIDNNSRSDQNTVTKKYLILYRFAKLKKGKKKKSTNVLRLTASNPRGQLFSADIEIQASVQFHY